jgi:hypothetical protein
VQCIATVYFFSVLRRQLPSLKLGLNGIRPLALVVSGVLTLGGGLVLLPLPTPSIGALAATAGVALIGFLVGVWFVRPEIAGWRARPQPTAEASLRANPVRGSAPLERPL